MPLKLVLLLLSLHEATAGLMCYHCSDSSNEDGKNSCQTWWRTMRRQRLDYEEKGEIGTFIKNCTAFAGKEDSEVFCAITSVQLGGGMRSYIRDCSDGEKFFGADYNEEFLEGNVLANNQTTCRYNGQGYVACVTLCGGRGDKDNFCNGPNSTSHTRTSFITSISAALLWVLFRNILS